MKNVTEIRKFQIFSFNELSESARDIVKNMYLEMYRQDGSLTDVFNEQLSETFPNSDLHVQYSLSSCQGDGVNIYGTLSLNDMLNHAKPALSYECENCLESIFKDIISDITLPANDRYCYCICDRQDIYGTISDALCDYVDVDEFSLSDAIAIKVAEPFIKQFEGLTKEYLHDLCTNMEKQGYNYLYEVDDETVKEFAETNDWMFYEDGRLYTYDSSIETYMD